MLVDIILNTLLSFVFVWGFLPVMLMLIPIVERYVCKEVICNQFDI